MIDALSIRNAMTIPQLWATRVADSPNATFLVHESGCWTYADALRMIETVARQLLSFRNANAPFRVASYLGNTPETLWAWFGALRAGATYLALNRAHKGILLREMLERSRAQVLVTDAAGIGDLKLSGVAAGMPVVSLSGATISMAGWGSTSTALMPLPQLSDDPYTEAIVLYTSGSTGRSKAVRLAHVALTHGATRVARAWSMSEKDVFHAWLPHFHIAGQLHQTTATIVAGGSIALFPTFSASRFWQQVRKVGATVVVGLPSVVNILWKTPANPVQDRTTLRLWLTTTIDPAIQAPFERRFGVRILSEYGMTEAEQITLQTCDEAVPSGSCGRAGPDWDLAVVDDNDRPVPVKTVGQIVVRPKVPGILMLGYEGDDAVFADALRNGWFHCGDNGLLDEDGYLYFVDRRRHAIRRRGENISSLELEQIIETHPAVACCVAVGVPSPLGEEDVKVVLELYPGVTFRFQEFYGWCQTRMANFMVPRFVSVVDAIPYTPVGKPDKEAVRLITGEEWDAERNGKPP
jgi:carnitine-CoA ligase